MSTPHVTRCRYCHGAGCLACDGEAGRVDAPPLTTRPPVGQTDPLVIVHPQGNPCVTVFGPGPAGATCAGCALLAGRQFSRIYWKCRLRPLTGGPGTDHHKRWPACAKYEAGTPEVYYMSH